jgi:hypothetical protein
MQSTTPSARLTFAIPGFLWVAIPQSNSVLCLARQRAPPQSGAIIIVVISERSESQFTFRNLSERFTLGLEGGLSENLCPR